MTKGNSEAILSDDALFHLDEKPLFATMQSFRLSFLSPTATLQTIFHI